MQFHLLAWKQSKQILEQKCVTDLWIAKTVATKSTAFAQPTTSDVTAATVCVLLDGGVLRVATFVITGLTALMEVMSSTALVSPTLWNAHFRWRSKTYTFL